MKSHEAKVHVSEDDGMWYATLSVKVPLSSNESDITAALITQKIKTALIGTQKEYFTDNQKPELNFEHDCHPPLPEPSTFAPQA